MEYSFDQKSESLEQKEPSVELPLSWQGVFIAFDGTPWGPAVADALRNNNHEELEAVWGACASVAITEWKGVQQQVATEVLLADAIGSDLPTARDMLGVDTADPQARKALLQSVVGQLSSVITPPPLPHPEAGLSELHALLVRRFSYHTTAGDDLGARLGERVMRMGSSNRKVVPAKNFIAHFSGGGEAPLFPVVNELQLEIMEEAAKKLQDYMDQQLRNPAINENAVALLARTIGLEGQPLPFRRVITELRQETPDLDETLLREEALSILEAIHQPKTRGRSSTSRTKTEKDEAPAAADGELDTMSLLKSQTRKYQLLTPEQEVAYAQAIEAGLFAQAALEGEFPPPADMLDKEGQLTPLAQTELRKLIHIGEEAFSNFILSNIRLVHHNARRYLGRGMDYMDLVQEGTVGLRHAVEKFDFKQGFKFSTYATHWIQQAMMRAIADKARVIRLPVHVVEEVKVLNRAINELSRENITPTVEALAKHMQKKPEKIQMLLNARREVISLDMPLGDDGDASFGDLLADEFDDTAAAATQNLVSQEVQEALFMLSHREYRIVVGYFGLDGKDPKSMSSIALELELPLHKVQKIFTGAMWQLRMSGKFFEGE